jgi:hypothetical protein
MLTYKKFGKSMQSGTSPTSKGRLSAFVVRHLPHAEDRPWTHATKVALWLGLAGASWVAVIAAGYFVWTAL